MDLRLFPIDSHHPQADDSVWGYSHTVLNVPRDGSGAIEAIQELKAAPLPKNHNIYGFLAGRVTDGRSEGEWVYGVFRTDPYGDPYTWIRADILAHTLMLTLHSHPTTAYISRLPGDTMVILGWL